jgi:hypothetical protein
MPKHDLLRFSFNTSEYHLALIHTGLEPHQMAWMLDNRLDTRFWRMDKFLEINTGEPPSEHTGFFYQHEMSNSTFWLLANQGSSEFLVHTKPKPDFVLVAKGDSCLAQLQQWLELLKTAKDISLAYQMPEKNKTKLQWLVWLEQEEKNDTEFDT